MTKEQIKNISTYSGIILFYSNQCKVCSVQKELYEKVLKKFDSVDCFEDPNYYIENFDIDVLPETRIYENGKVVWKKIDLTSEEDLNFLKGY